MTRESIQHQPKEINCEAFLFATAPIVAYSGNVFCRPENDLRASSHKFKHQNKHQKHAKHASIDSVDQLSR